MKGVEFEELMQSIYNPQQGTEIRIEGEDYMFDEDELYGAGGWINLTKVNEAVNASGVIIDRTMVLDKDQMIDLGYKQYK